MGNDIITFLWSLHQRSRTRSNISASFDLWSILFCLSVNRTCVTIVKLKLHIYLQNSLLLNLLN